MLVGGIDSTVRACKAMEVPRLFIKTAKASKIEHEDGIVYVDYVSSEGTLILGSANPKVARSLRRYMSRGTSYGAPTKLETKRFSEFK
jgi:glutamate-1-semialdehyde 2,1-aminomutase